MKTLDLVIAFVAGVGIGLLLAAMLDQVERREHEGMSQWPSL